MRKPGIKINVSNMSSVLNEMREKHLVEPNVPIKVKKKHKSLSEGEEYYEKDIRLYVQSDLAEAVGVENETLNRWIRGSATISRTHLEKLANLLRVFPEYLTGDSPIMNQEEQGRSILEKKSKEDQRIAARNNYLCLMGVLEDEPKQPMRVNGVILKGMDLINYYKAIDEAVEKVSELYANAYRKNSLRND